jgi:enamine deaminase RidA (YjgF/YER057c/UK114 family)
MNRILLQQKLAALKIDLPQLSGPFGSYLPAKRAGDLIFLAGQLPMKDGKLLATGKVPSACSVEQARLAARQCVINALAAAIHLVPDRGIAGVAQVRVMVNSDPTFTDQSKIANGASELLEEIFGAAGKHARTSIGVAALPLDSAVEVEVVFEADPRIPAE